MQGLLELAGVPYVGAGVLASALCMDKDVFKAVLRDHGIPVTANITLRLGDEPRNPFGYPCFVKPARLGSSVGITKAHDEDELRRGVALAFEHDEKVLVEQFVPGVEVEVGVLGNLRADRVAARRDRRHAQRVVRLRSEVRRGRDGPRRPCARHASSRSSARKSSLCARSSRPTAKGWRAPTCSCATDGEVLVNELNTIPGFTSTSVYARLFEASGISYPSCCSGSPTSPSSVSSGAADCASRRCQTPKVSDTLSTPKSPYPPDVDPEAQRADGPGRRGRRPDRERRLLEHARAQVFASPRRASPLPADRHRAGRGDLERRRSSPSAEPTSPASGRRSSNASCSATAASKTHSADFGRRHRSPTSCSNACDLRRASFAGCRVRKARVSFCTPGRAHRRRSTARRADAVGKTSSRTDRCSRRRSGSR